MLEWVSVMPIKSHNDLIKQTGMRSAFSFCWHSEPGFIILLKSLMRFVASAEAALSLQVPWSGGLSHLQEVLI